MTSLRLALIAVVLIVPMSVSMTSAQAASAHNSQAGANGPTTKNEAPTGRHLRSAKRPYRKRAM